MITLQKMPKELEAFIKQQGLAWLSRFVGEHQTAIQVCLRNPTLCAFTEHAYLQRAARPKMSAGSSFELALATIATMPRQTPIVHKYRHGDCYYGDLSATAKKVRVRPNPIGRPTVLSC